MDFEPDPPRRAVVIDTNALYSMPIADTLLRAADRELFDFLWTEDIMQEPDAAAQQISDRTEVPADD